MREKGKKRIAVNTSNFCGWGGGIDFIRLILNGLVMKNKSNEFEIFVFIRVEKYRYNNKFFILWEKFCDKFLHNYEKDYAKDLLSDKHFALLDVLKNVNGVFRVVFYRSGMFDSILRKFHIDVCLPIGPSLDIEKLSIPYVGYLYDFQYEYYPQFFSAEEMLERRRTFQYALNRFKVIIVNAQSVKHDIEKFYPAYTGSIYTLPFAASPCKNWFERHNFDEIKQHYCLPEKYFLISNQFWQHKSHITAFEALALLAHKDVHIICTGKESDNRKLLFFEYLKNQVSVLKLESRVHFLGHIPKEDQIMIMRHSIAVVQPTLFEGGPGGGCAYDAVAIGVPVILSNIPVNLEISDEKNIHFFKAGDAHDLSVKMEQILVNGYEKIPENKLIAYGEERIEFFGDELLGAIAYAQNINKGDM